MPLPKLRICGHRPAQAAQFAVGAVRADLGGGAGYYRADFDGATHMVSVEWRVGRTDNQYMLAFFRQHMAAGAPFLVDLMLDADAAVEYTAQLVPGTFRQAVLAHREVYQATLEVRPAEHDDEYDLSVIDVVDAYGDDWDAIFLALHELVHEDLPEALS